MNCEIINTLNIKCLFSVLKSLAHLARACHFKFPFLQNSFIRFSKLQLLSIVMPRNISLELLSITELLILIDFALKCKKNEWNFEAFALKFLWHNQLKKLSNVCLGKSLLKSDSHFQKYLRYLFQWKAFKNYKKMLLILPWKLFSFKIFKFLSWLFANVEKTAWLER